MMIIFASGVALALVLSVLDWPFYPRHPVAWRQATGVSPRPLVPAAASPRARGPWQLPGDTPACQADLGRSPHLLTTPPRRRLPDPPKKEDRVGDKPAEGEASARRRAPRAPRRRRRSSGKTFSQPTASAAPSPAEGGGGGAAGDGDGAGCGDKVVFKKAGPVLPPLAWRARAPERCGGGARAEADSLPRGRGRVFQAIGAGAAVRGRAGGLGWRVGSSCDDATRPRAVGRRAVGGGWAAARDHPSRGFVLYCNIVTTLVAVTER